MQVEDTVKACSCSSPATFSKPSAYDIARSEFTTVVNRYAKTPQAIEGEFGIGETYLAQKVYDQAEAVFEKLARSTDSTSLFAGSSAASSLSAGAIAMKPATSSAGHRAGAQC